MDSMKQTTKYFAILVALLVVAVIVTNGAWIYFRFFA